MFLYKKNINNFWLNKAPYLQLSLNFCLHTIPKSITKNWCILLMKKKKKKKKKLKLGPVHTAYAQSGLGKCIYV